MTNFEKIRLAVFLGTLITCALAERLLPRRIRTVDAGPRWFANLSLSALGTLLVAILLPFTALATAHRVEAAQFGLLNQWSIYYPLKFILSFLLLDLLIYLQHRLFHWVPMLWRLHAVHHTDLDLDASSAVRFHPLEILGSMLIKIAGIALFGAHFLAVAVFEVVLNATAVFNHSNLNLGPLDRLLRLFLVTPDMHRVHHSPRREETDSNFGFNLPWWDFILGTYRAQPGEPHETMAMGLDGARDPQKLDLFSLLGRPFKRTL